MHLEVRPSSNSIIPLASDQVVCHISVSLSRLSAISNLSRSIGEGGCSFREEGFRLRFRRSLQLSLCLNEQVKTSIYCFQPVRGQPRPGLAQHRVDRFRMAPTVIPSPRLTAQPSKAFRATGLKAKFFDHGHQRCTKALGLFTP